MPNVSAIPKMEAFTAYNIVIAVFSILAFLSNLSSLIYLRSNFDTKQVYFYILSLDAIITMMATVISMITFFAIDLGTVACSVLSLGSSVTVLTSPLANFLISFIRYKRITNVPNTWKSNEELIRKSNFAFLFMVIYGVSITFLNSYFELKSYNNYTVCLEGPQAKINNVTFNVLTVLAPLMIYVIVTSALDISSYLKLQNSVGPMEDYQSCTFNADIPLRASLFDTHLLMLYFSVYIILGANNVQPLEKYLVAVIGIRIKDIVRNPLILTYALKRSEEIRERFAAQEDREKRRQKEIFKAIIKKAARRKLEKDEHSIEMSPIINSSACSR